MTKMTMTSEWIAPLAIAAGLAMVAGLVLAGCGGRAPIWDAPIGDAKAFALGDAMAISDPAGERVVLLTTDENRAATLSAVSIQRGVRAVAVAPNRSKLFVVSAGDDGALPPVGRTAQAPALEIVTRDPAARASYPLSEALAGLALDPSGQWAVLFADSSSQSLVRNPNELLLVDLTLPASAGTSKNPIAHTLRSFGGKPQRFTFTDELQLPGGPRRLLVIETEQDVALIDLLHPSDPEITIQLSSGEDTRQVHPASVAVTDGDAGPNDARIAIRVDNNSVVIATLAPSATRDFSPTLNLTDVGGVPSDVAWVRTDAGALALAALVPTAGKAVVIDPTTGLTVDVALPAAYRRLSLVTTESASAASSVDVALLWNASSGGVSFWELGRVAGQPYRSVEVVGSTPAVTSVQDVQGLHPELKILGTNAASFFLLDLKARTSAPFVTTASNVNLLPSTVGDRAWAFVPGDTQLASVDLQTLHPAAMHVERPISGLFEIGAADDHTGGAARSLVALHQTGTWGVSIYDATAVDHTDDHTNLAGILLEDAHAP